MENYKSHNQTSLEQKVNQARDIHDIVCISIDIFVSLASFCVFLVVLMRHRSGLFILAIPVLFVIYGVLSFIFFFHRLDWD